MDCSWSIRLGVDCWGGIGDCWGSIGDWSDGVVSNWGSDGVVDHWGDDLGVDSRGGLRDDGVESIDVIGGVVDGSD